MIARWRLTPDGASFETRYGNHLAPVLLEDGRLAMLKVIASEDEKPGVAALRYFGGVGAAVLYRSEDGAALMQRLTGPDLAALAREDDDRATHILCDVLAALHAPRQAAVPSGLHDLTQRFGALERAAARTDFSPRMRRDLSAGWETASHLLVHSADERVLHGDMHHENVLSDDAGVWRAIDPKGVLGDPGYDYANIFLNPWVAPEVARVRFARRAEIIAARANREIGDVLAWVEAHAMLSAAWTLEDSGDPAWACEIARLARASRDDAKR